MKRLVTWQFAAVIAAALVLSQFPCAGSNALVVVGLSKDCTNSSALGKVFVQVNGEIAFHQHVYWDQRPTSVPTCVLCLSSSEYLIGLVSLPALIGLAV